MHSVRNHPGLKIIAISTCLLFILLFSACSIGSVFKTIFRIFGKAEGDHGADAEEYAVMIKVLDAIQSRDENALRKLFSPKTVVKVDGFDQSMRDLFDYYQGEYISIEYKGSSGSESLDYGEKQRYIGFSYDVKTNKNEFRFSIDCCTADSADGDNVGIFSLYIIKMEDDTDPEYGYGGDGKETPGINIGIRNVLPIEEE